MATVKKVTSNNESASSVKKPKTAAKKVSPIPKGYASITPYLIVDNANKAIEFYKKVFKAKVLMRLDMPNKKVGHAEIKIGDSIVMLADSCPEMGALSPIKGGNSAVSIHLYHKDVNAVVKAAVAAGAKLTRKPEDMFYGDRSGGFLDPFGHSWYVATHIEDVTLAKVKKRMAEMKK